jgi:hypothetical protein
LFDLRGRCCKSSIEVAATRPNAKRCDEITRLLWIIRTPQRIFDIRFSPKTEFHRGSWNVRFGPDFDIGIAELPNYFVRIGRERTAAA